jgi:hypothetical protein
MEEINRLYSTESPLGKISYSSGYKFPTSMQPCSQELTAEYPEPVKSGPDHIKLF